MEPLKPEVRRQILAADPTAEADIGEYERLLAERFMNDPNVPSADAVAEAARTGGVPRGAAIVSREARLAQLHRKLFPAED